MSTHQPELFVLRIFQAIFAIEVSLLLFGLHIAIFSSSQIPLSSVRNRSPHLRVCAFAQGPELLKYGAYPQQDFGALPQYFIAAIGLVDAFCRWYIYEDEYEI